MVIDNNFQTPPAICDYMVDMVPYWAIRILEPTPGLGYMVQSLQKKDKYSIVAPNDFFLMDKEQKFDCIVMNPPFSSKSAYMQHAPLNAETRGMKLGYYILTECMKMSNNVIALMSWFTLSDSDVRLRYLKNYGIKSLTALPRKTFQYARIQTVVIELENGFTGQTIFKTFEF